jgi:hypothetical protein
MKTQIKWYINILLFLFFIPNNIFPFNFSLASNVYVTLECSDYADFEYAYFKNMYVPTYWQFEVTQGGGDLTIVNPAYYPLYSFATEPAVNGYKNITSTGSVAISIGISAHNRINNKYRDIVFKYRYSTNIHGS